MVKQKSRLDEMLGFMEERVDKKGGKIKELVSPYFYRIEYPNNKNSNIILLSEQVPMKILSKIYNQIKKEAPETYPIFYKDGKTFFRRVVEHNSALRDSKSLKKYDLNTINKMIALTIQERFSLTDFDENFFESKISNYDTAINYFPTKMLCYYQPQIKKLKENFRFFKPYPIIFDYSHITRNDERYSFIKNNPSKTYFILKEIIFKN